MPCPLTDLEFVPYAIIAGVTWNKTERFFERSKRSLRNTRIAAPALVFSRTDYCDYFCDNLSNKTFFSCPVELVCCSKDKIVSLGTAIFQWPLFDQQRYLAVYPSTKRCMKSRL
jgi:hypothetical protein